MPLAVLSCNQQKDSQMRVKLAVRTAFCRAVGRAVTHTSWLENRLVAELRAAIAQKLKQHEAG